MEREETDQYVDERALAMFPLGILSHQSEDHYVRYQDKLYLDGFELNRVTTIEKSKAFGLPTSADEAVWLAFLTRLAADRFATNEIEFTVREMLLLMGKKDTGPNRKAFHASLNRLGNVVITTETFKPENPDEHYDHQVIQPIQVDIKGGGIPKVTIAKAVFEALVDGRYQVLSAPTYQGLPLGVARRLYRYLELVKIEHPESYTEDLGTLCYEHIGITRGQTLAQARRLLDRAHEELLAVKVIQGVEYVKPRGRPARVTYVFAPQDPVEIKVIEDLVQRGVSAKVAKDLVTKFDVETIQHHIYAFDQSKAKRSPGWLVKSIADAWVHKLREQQQPLLIVIDEEPPKGSVLDQSEVDKVLEGLDTVVFDELRDQVVRDIYGANRTGADFAPDGSASSLAKNRVRAKIAKLWLKQQAANPAKQP